MQDSMLQVYKGKNYRRAKTKNTSRVIAFDLDETLGSFVDLDLLWRTFMKHKITVNFNDLLDLYPEFLRYGIIHILEYLYQKKTTGQCYKIYIYTNNQCDPSWTLMISDYFDYKLKTHDKLFDKIIYAFKINNKPIELARTTHDKTYNDFIKCTLLPKTTELCFVDNSEFDEMKKDRVYYICPKSYYHHLTPNEIVQRLIESNLLQNNTIDINVLTKQLGINRNYRITSPELNATISHKIMYHIKEFFFFTNKKTRTKKFKLSVGKNTRKKRTY